MSVEDHRNAQLETRSYLDDNGFSDHIFYGPTSNRYWSEPIRMVAINLETWGYKGSGIFSANDGELTKWLNDSKSDSRAKTARGTFALMTVALSHLQGGTRASYAAFKAAFHDQERLEETLLRTTYYNIRPDSNPNKNQDFEAIASVGSSDLGQLIWKEILALDPHVVFVSGKAGLQAVNRLLGLKTQIKFRDCYVHSDGFVIQSIAHPSRSNYSKWTSAVESIEREWLQMACLVNE
jgi:hypothetical protein